MNCSVVGCARPQHARGWCQGHYLRWYKTGDVQADRPIGEHKVIPGRSFEEKFEAGLPTPLPNHSECWEWRGTRSHYGVVSHGRRNHYAHRIAWERAAGRRIPAGKVVRHTCDNKFCVNPAHLVIGKQVDNVRDAVVRGLNCRGESHGRSALDEVAVREIKRLLRDTDLTHRQIAQRFPVITRSAIEGIASGRTWSWVEAADYPLPS